MNELKVQPRINITKVDSLPGEESKYLLEISNRHYFIGGIIYLIIEKLQNNNSLEEITKTINESFKPEPEFTQTDIGNIIENNLKPMGLFDDNTVDSKISTSIKARITLLNEKTIIAICMPFRFLFQPLFFYISTFIALLINLYFLFFRSNPLISIDVEFFKTGIDSSFFIMVYPSIFLLTILHEFGHAAASLYYNVKPKEIGFGFYLLMPVFYTDVTRIWVLSKRKKVIVNLAGIYVQLILNMILIIILNLVENKMTHVLLFQLALINISTVLINLLPFIKYDAYWLISDITGIPNLKRKSLEFMNSVFLKLIGRKKIHVRDYSLSLIIYSVTSFSFFILVYYLMLNLLLMELSYFDVFITILKNFNFSILSMLYILKTCSIYLFGGYMIYYLLNPISKLLLTKK